MNRRKFLKSVVGGTVLGLAFPFSIFTTKQQGVSKKPVIRHGAASKMPVRVSSGYDLNMGNHQSLALDQQVTRFECLTKRGKQFGVDVTGNCSESQKDSAIMVLKRHLNNLSLGNKDIVPLSLDPIGTGVKSEIIYI